MAALPAKRPNRAGRGGPARGYSWAPFAKRNDAAATHRFYVTPTLRPEDRAEVELIVAGLREATPFYSPAFEPQLEQLACRVWRQRRAYADLAEHGVVRGGKPAPILVHLVSLENAISRDLAELGMTARSAAALGLDVAMTQRTLSLVDLAAAAALEGDGDEGDAA